MIKKGDKLIIVAEAVNDEHGGTVYIKLPSDSQHSMVMLTENCKKVPGPLEDYVPGTFNQGYNTALEECGVIEDGSNERT